MKEQSDEHGIGTLKRFRQWQAKKPPGYWEIRFGVGTVLRNEGKGRRLIERVWEDYSEKQNWHRESADWSCRGENGWQRQQREIIPVQRMSKAESGHVIRNYGHEVLTFTYWLTAGFWKLRQALLDGSCANATSQKMFPVGCVNWQGFLKKKERFQRIDHRCIIPQNVSS